MQGLVEFASLLEQSDPKHRDSIMKEVEAEDPDFLASVLSKVVYFEDLTALDEAVLAEILSKVSPKILSFALHGMPEEFRKELLRHLGHRGTKQLLDEVQMWTKPPEPSFVLGARKQVLKIARMLEAQNKFVLDVRRAPKQKAAK